MKKKINQKKVGIAIIILLAIICSLVIIVNVLYKNNSKKELKDSNEILSPKELLEYYDCKDISIQDSTEKEFQKDIFLVFGEDLWMDDKSNEIYYNSLILDLSRTMEYVNYRMIDSYRELVIAVACNKEQKTTSAVFINGEANYFQNEATRKKAESDYKRIETTKMVIESPEVIELIKNEWHTDAVDFGTVESRFDNYDIYFDEGINIKSIGGKVFNIIFTEKYEKSIINGLKVNSDESKTKSILGNPQFEDYYVFGYKGDKIYIFFLENEVSIYRIEDDYLQDDFLKLWNELNETKNIKTFINEMKVLWKDYDEFSYGSDWASLQYTLRGIMINLNMSGETGIALYNNFNGMLQDEITLEKITRENLPEHVYLKTDKDLVFEVEKNRATHRASLYNEEIIEMQECIGNKVVKNYDDFEEIDYDFSDYKSNKFNLIYSYTEDEGIYGVQFVSKNREYPDSELIRHRQIYTYGWINNEEFIYSVKGEGIYLYNAITRELSTLMEGTEDYFIKGIDNNYLLYDDGKLNIK